ncbi:hypothetical protein [Petrocella sp. FN5]|uniref:hypothetical protein n=1 Tax=Petrocella sp. FN5 TaxID=3032002 RepID=UPI0023DAA35F|nr:hypothetical protein [Petrocella sp. FN5]MDF1618560.1 hypothetical protein [Petrocella sp. FN5]
MKKRIGFIDNEVCSNKEVEKQIDELKKFELDVHTKSGEKITWEKLEGAKDSIFRAILDDRVLRVNKEQMMADRPTMCCVTINENRIIRIEYYEGHDKLEQIYDIRFKDDYGKQLERSYDDIGLYTTGDTWKEIKQSKGFGNLIDKAHRLSIQRPKEVEGTYFGRKTETLMKHRENLMMCTMEVLQGA